MINFNKIIETIRSAVSFAGKALSSAYSTGATLISNISSALKSLISKKPEVGTGGKPQVSGIGEGYLKGSSLSARSVAHPDSNSDEHFRENEFDSFSNFVGGDQDTEKTPYQQRTEASKLASAASDLPESSSPRNDSDISQASVALNMPLTSSKNTTEVINQWIQDLKTSPQSVSLASSTTSQTTNVSANRAAILDHKGVASKTFDDLVNKNKLGNFAQQVFLPKLKGLFADISANMQATDYNSKSEHVEPFINLMLLMQSSHYNKIDLSVQSSMKSLLHQLASEEDRMRVPEEKRTYSVLLQKAIEAKS